MKVICIDQVSARITIPKALTFFRTASLQFKLFLSIFDQFKHLYLFSPYVIFFIAVHFHISIYLKSDKAEQASTVKSGVIDKKDVKTFQIHYNYYILICFSSTKMDFET